MNRFYLICIMIALSEIILTGCEKPAVGYLMTESASYGIDQITVLHLDTVTEANNPIVYKKYQDRIAHKSPWVTSQVEGVLGTEPMIYSVEDVKVIGKGDASVFKQEIQIMGGGRFVFPFSFASPDGLYVISIRITNEGYSKVILDAFYFSIE